MGSAWGCLGLSHRDVQGNIGLCRMSGVRDEFRVEGIRAWGRHLGFRHLGCSRHSWICDFGCRHWGM